MKRQFGEGARNSLYTTRLAARSGSRAHRIVDIIEWSVDPTANPLLWRGRHSLSYFKAPILINN